jgi:hypothetical protein
MLLASNAMIVSGNLFYPELLLVGFLFRRKHVFFYFFSSFQLCSTQPPLTPSFYTRILANQRTINRKISFQLRLRGVKRKICCKRRSTSVRMKSRFCCLPIRTQIQISCNTELGKITIMSAELRKIGVR